MRYRSRAMLGPIVLGLLTAGLCTLIAPAQQPANPPAAVAPAADAKGKPASSKPSAATPADQPASPKETSQDQSTSGAAKPEPVTAEPAPASDQNAAPLPDDTSTPQGDGSLLEEGTKENRFAPDQPSTPMTPELDTNKPTPPDPKPELPAVEHVTPAPSDTTPPATTPAALTASPVAPANSTPAQEQQAPATPTNPSAPAPDANAPQQNPPADSNPAPPDTPAQQAPTPSTGQAEPPAADQQTAPATNPGNNQTPAPAAPSPEQTPVSSNPPSEQTPAPASPPSDNQAPAAAPAPQDQTPASPASPADAGTQPVAAPSESQDGSNATSAPSDSQAVNPSLPAPQVNEAEPPPASRLDIFGGYTYLRPTGKVGTWSFPTQNTRGYIASGTYYFTRHFGVQGEFSHSEYPLGTTGTSPAPPFVQLGGVTDSFYTAEAGGVYRFFLGQRLIPFVHFTGGGAKVAGPKFQPPTWGYGFAGGGGLDVLLPKTNEHVAFRLVQADYEHMHADQGPLQKYDLAGGTQDVNALRLSAGLVFRFGEMNPIQQKSLACDATPADVYAGERVTLAATLRNYKDKLKHPFVFNWILTGGKQLGFGPVIFVDTTGLAAGTYHATVHISAKEKGRQFAQCSANFTVKQSPPPTLKCSPDPSTVTPGQVSIITAYAGSIPQRQLTYSYTTSEGQISGKDNTAQLHTDGLPPGVANITCRVQDDLGQVAVATTEVTIAPPALPPAPHAQPLCTVYFNRDMRRPTRVDNEGRACLDDIALTMEHQPDARLVLIGEHSDSEADGQLTAAERAINTRAYLANEKGIDPSRVDVRTSTTPGRQVQTFLLAPGAIFDQPTEGRIDESKIKIHGQQYARQKMRPPQKGPVGEGVSHPPKN